jgi:hypothetical protein
MLTPRFVDRVRLLPYSWQVTVEVGDWVSEQQTVARIDYMPGTMRRFDAAPTLRVSGKGLRDCMLLPEGAPVEVGDPVAASYSFGDRRVVTTPYKGFIGLVSRALGHIYIREPIPVGSGEPLVLNVPEQLGVRPLLVGDCLRVIVGSAVIPDQVIAIRRSGRETLTVQSSVYGKVTSIVDGVVTITPLHVRTEMAAYLAGRVIEVMPGQGVVVRAFAYQLQGQYGVGGETGGELLLAGQADSVLTPADVSDGWKDKVVVVGATAGLETMRKAAEVGARALVMAHQELRTLTEFTNGSGTVGLTGDEDVPLTVVLTEGFAPSPISKRCYDTLQALAGRYAAVNGTTHIRAGVIRPEVIVCVQDWPDQPVAAPEEPEIAIGMTVRVTRQPLMGTIGRVVDLPVKRQLIATGSEVRVADVEFSGGITQVPVSNLEIWLETEVDQRG